VLGVIHLKDVIKEGIRERFARLGAMGMRTVMTTGDNPLIAAAIAAESGVDDFRAEATPETKLQLIREEQAQGKLVASWPYKPAPEISSPNDEARRLPNILRPRRISVAPRDPELPIPQARARLSYQNSKRNRRNTAPALWGCRISCYAAGDQEITKMRGSIAGWIWPTEGTRADLCNFIARHFGTELGTPKPAGFALEAPTRVLSSSLLDPVMRTSFSSTWTRCASARRWSRR
jgi:hypothetical protein